MDEEEHALEGNKIGLPHEPFEIVFTEEQFVNKDIVDILYEDYKESSGFNKQYKK